MTSNFHFRNVFAACLAGFLASAPSLRADAPGSGLTAQFEITFLEFTIDHHFSALRMTELAAGTNPNQQAAVSADDGTAPTPGYASTAAKASLADLKSLARRENKTQREEILTAQRLLKTWYGITYQPSVLPENQTQISILEAAPAGVAFNKAFAEALSRHHYTIIQQAAACLSSSDLHHLDTDLSRYCGGIMSSQLNDIDALRHSLFQYGIYDYQPLSDPKGTYTDPNP